jgi:hypothetical protein
VAVNIAETPTPSAMLSHWGQLRQTEIENLGVPTFRSEYVGRLDVAVDDAFGVGGIESIGILSRRNTAGRLRVKDLHTLAG